MKMRQSPTLSVPIPIGATIFPAIIAVELSRQGDTQPMTS
jgi:hypothetical protein